MTEHRAITLLPRRTGWQLLLVRPGLAVSQSKRLIEGYEELGQGETECACQSIHNIGGGCLLPALEVADIGPMETGSVCQLLLG